MCTRFYIEKENAELQDIIEAAERSALTEEFLLIPASYYYEWEHFTAPNGKTKTGRKFLIQPAGATITYLCGLYRLEDDLPAFTVLTREPSEELKDIHDRMPLILPEYVINDWINIAADPSTLLPLSLTDMVFEPAENE